MKALSVITLLTLLSISCAHEAKNQSSSNSTSDSIVPTFLKQEEAALLLQKKDEHIRRWSSFDLASHTVGIEGGKQGYLQFAGAQTRNWNDEETALLQKSSQSINQIIREKELKLPFPEEVRLIKSTIKEEGGAGGYTRDTYIVLIDRLLEHPEYVTKLLAHEAFHVLTRNNPDFRKKMYSIIGFNILPKEIEFPEELKERFIRMLSATIAMLLLPSTVKRKIAAWLFIQPDLMREAASSNTSTLASFPSTRIPAKRLRKKVRQWFTLLTKPLIFMTEWDVILSTSLTRKKC